MNAERPLGCLPQSFGGDRKAAPPNDAASFAHLGLPEGASPNVRGPVFNHAWFAFAGFTRSRRPEAHHNRLNAYRLTPEGRAAMAVEQ